jgi:hypothetical protein
MVLFVPLQISFVLYGRVSPEKGNCSDARTRLEDSVTLRTVEKAAVPVLLLMLLQQTLALSITTKVLRRSGPRRCRRL